MKAKDLKNSILQMAVEGKLVPQDPSDEPASILLDRIREEKHRLIAEGKAKFPKGGESVIYFGSDGSPYEKRVDAKGHVLSDECIASEVPFGELPEGWAWARLGSAFHMQAGKNIKASLLFDEQTEKAPYPCFGGNGIRGFVAKSNTRGDYPIIGRQGALCGNVKRATGEFYATEHAVVVTCFSNTNVAWVCCFLTALNLNQYATATAQPGLAVSKISSVLIPVPPLAEQRRIVERVGELMPLVEEYGGLEDAREALDAALPGRLRKSVLQLAVRGGLAPQDPTDEPAGVLLERIRGQRRQLVAEGKMKAPKGGESIIFAGSDGRRYEKRADAKGRESEPACIEDELPFEIPEGWEWARLGSVFSMQAGKNIKASLLSDIQTENMPYPCFGGNGVRGFVAKPNASGDFPIIGRQGALCGNVRRASGDFYATEHAVIVSCFLNADIAWACLFLSALNLNQYATATAQPGLAVSKISEVLIPIPPLAEQHRIVDRFVMLEPLVTNH